MTAFVGVVVGVVVRGGRALALRRAAHRDVGAGIWETVSGRLERGEQPLDALAREIAEETGLEQVSIDPVPIDAYVAMRGEKPMLVVAYRAVATGGEPRLSSEHDALRWADVTELRALGMPSRLVETVERALRR
jgi:8-oxo-dGTP diphosphatase